MSIEQEKGIVTLLPKTNKNRLYIKRWRLLCLLNTHYKIIANILVSRLKGVTTFNLKYNDQSAYKKGHYIEQNIRTHEDVTYSQECYCL